MLSKLSEWLSKCLYKIDTFIIIEIMMMAPSIISMGVLPFRSLWTPFILCNIIVWIVSSQRFQITIRDWWYSKMNA